MGCGWAAIANETLTDKQALACLSHLLACAFIHLESILDEIVAPIGASLSGDKALWGFRGRSCSRCAVFFKARTVNVRSAWFREDSHYKGRRCSFRSSHHGPLHFCAPFASCIRKGLLAEGVSSAWVRSEPTVQRSALKVRVPQRRRSKHDGTNPTFSSLWRTSETGQYGFEEYGFKYQTQ